MAMDRFFSLWRRQRIENRDEAGNRRADEREPLLLTDLVEPTRPSPAAR